MPAVVLRHPDLPGQPIVVDVPVGAYVPAVYRDAKWEIDTATSVEDAITEATDTHEAAVVKAQDDAQDFKPEFPPVDDTAPVDTSAPAPADDTPPANPAFAPNSPSPTPSPTPEPVDTSKEN